MLGGFARRLSAPDYPCGLSGEAWEDWMEYCQQNWGGPAGLDRRWPSAANDERVRQWWASLLRMGASPGANRALQRMNGDTDVRHVLPVIRVPTLLLHSVGDRALPVAGSRYMAERIPGAKYVELPGSDHLAWARTGTRSWTRSRSS
jgi:pimeloyl-ACP methyl ester carboxylesterase